MMVNMIWLEDRRQKTTKDETMYIKQMLENTCSHRELQVIWTRFINCWFCELLNTRIKWIKNIKIINYLRRASYTQVQTFWTHDRPQLALFTTVWVFYFWYQSCSVLFSLVQSCSGLFSLVQFCSVLFSFVFWMSYECEDTLSACSCQRADSRDRVLDNVSDVFWAGTPWHDGVDRFLILTYSLFPRSIISHCRMYVVDFPPENSSSILMTCLAWSVDKGSLAICILLSPLCVIIGVDTTQTHVIVWINRVHPGWNAEIGCITGASPFTQTRYMGTDHI